MTSINKFIWRNTSYPLFIIIKKFSSNKLLRNHFKIYDRYFKEAITNLHIVTFLIV